ncbi:gonadotropin-releasing hormone receptor-like [Dermacentor andersoni]|uniref:gonadotropin-releasing hormone receptor-like n=1 Tax=Dermacentor andersoni TaxID=34620 RepID=UPI0021550AA2|nr:gonadotropin-releasing hormone receptor-like [Dermacentor andersoni]XP_054932896.1 gonadotropin-releasing hormone receptor-like [Dermacentor andersoni]
MTASSVDSNVMEDAFGNISCSIIKADSVGNVSNATAAGSDDILGPRYHKRVRIVIIVIMIVASVVGNTVVCWKLVFKRRHRRVSKARVLFLNLAIADLLVACITMTSQVVWEVMGRVWIAGDAFCRFFKFMQTFALVSSTYMLVTIAVDRHIAITTPLAPSPDPWKLAALTWLASCMPSLPNVYVFHSVEVAPGKCFCASIFYDRGTPLYHRQIYMGFVFFMVFVAPLVLLFTFYTGILWTIWKHSSRSAKMGQQTSSSLPRAKVKTLKMTAVVFGAFLVTNVPYMVQEVILAFGNPGILDANVVALFGVISASNSAINPYIFLYFEKRQRRGTGSALSGMLKRLPCLGSRLAVTDRGAQQMVMLTVNYSGRHSRTITTVNCDSCACSENAHC